MDEYSDIWKQFGRVRPSHCALHHLIAVNQITDEMGYALCPAVADFLKLRKKSVSQTLSNLTKAGFLIKDRNHRYRLSSTGIEIVNTVLAKRNIVMQFLTVILGLSPAEAAADACKIEHLVGQEAADRLTALVGLLRNGSPSSKQLLAQLEETRVFCNPAEWCEMCSARCYYAVRPNRLETAV